MATFVSKRGSVSTHMAVAVEDGDTNHHLISTLYNIFQIHVFLGKGCSEYTASLPMVRSGVYALYYAKALSYERRGQYICTSRQAINTL